MPSTFSPNLGLELIATGENAGTWGDVTNINLRALDDAIDGVVNITVGSGGYTVTTDNTPAMSEGRSKVLSFGGPAGDNATIAIAPNDAEKWYYVRNNTDKPLTFSQGSGSVYVLAAGYCAVIHCDGAGTGASVTGTLSSIQCNKLLVRKSAAPGETGDMEVQGAATLAGAVNITGAVVMNALTVNGSAAFAGSLTASGATDVQALTAHGLISALGNLRINVGSDAAGDLYVRGADGSLVRVPIGTSGQFLRVSGAAPAWAASELALGTPVPGGVNTNLLYVAAGAVSQGGIAFDVATNTLAIKGNGVSSGLWLNTSAADASHALRFFIQDVPRWDIGLRTTGAYTQNLCTVRYNNAGTSLGIDFEIVRSDGRVLFGGFAPGAFSPLSVVSIQCGSALGTGLVIRRYSAASASSLQAWTDENGNVLSSITADGNFVSNTQNTKWQKLTRTTDYYFGSTGNTGYLVWYSPNANSPGTQDGFLTFSYPVGVSGGSFYATLPTTQNAGQVVSGLTWSYRFGGLPPLAQTFDEYLRESTEGIVSNILRYPDLVDRLREALR